jgi:hypothetical protein
VQAVILLVIVAKGAGVTSEQMGDKHYLNYGTTSGRTRLRTKLRTKLRSQHNFQHLRPSYGIYKFLVASWV